MNSTLTKILKLVSFVLFHILALIFSWVIFFAATSDLDPFDINNYLETFKASELKQTVKQVVEKKRMYYPVIEKLRGEVYIKGGKYKTRHRAIVGDKILEGQEVETLTDSDVIFSFGKKYKARMRLENVSKISADLIMSVDRFKKSERNIFTLHEGLVEVLFDNKTLGSSILIKTSLGRYETQSSSFIVQSSLADAFSLLAVNDGSVTLNESATTIGVNTGYINSRESGEKVFVTPDFCNQFSWNFDNLNVEIISDTKITKNFLLSHNSQILTSVAEGEKLEKEKILKEQLVHEIENFKKYSLSLVAKLEEVKVKHNEMELAEKTEMPKVRADLGCFANTKGFCQLQSEKIVFPNGNKFNISNPKERESITEALKKYVTDFNMTLDKLMESRIEIVKLIEKREEVVKSSEKKIEENKEFDKILEQLKDSDLNLKNE